MSSRYRQIAMLENEIRMRPTMPQGVRTRATKKMFSRRNASTFDYSIGKDQKEPKNVYVKLLSTFCQQIVNKLSTFFRQHFYVSMRHMSAASNSYLMYPG